MSHTYDLRKQPRKSAKMREQEIGLVAEEDVVRRDEDGSMEGSNASVSNASMDGRNAGGAENQETDDERQPHRKEKEDDPATKVLGDEKNNDIMAMLQHIMTTQNHLINTQNETKEEMKEEMRQNRLSQEETKEEMRQLKIENKLSQEEAMKQNRLSQEETKEEIRQLKVELQNQQKEWQKEIIRQVQREMEITQIKVENKIEELQEQIPAIAKKEAEILINKHEEKIEEYLDNKNIELVTQLNYNTNEISKQKQAINTMEARVLTIENKTYPQNKFDTTQIPEIVVNYMGNHHEPHMTLPKFNPKSRNPPEFLRQFDLYYNNYAKRRTQVDHLSYLELIEQCFEHSAASWFNIIKHDLHGREDLQQKFLKQYWSSDIQKGIRKRIDIEKYREEGKMNRTEYLLDRAITLRSMVPIMDESEIVEMLSHNFTERVRDMVKVQNIGTLERFMEILNREDLEVKTNKAKVRPNDNNNVNRNQQPTYRYPYNNFPRKEDKPTDSYGRFNKFTPRFEPTNKPRYQTNNYNQLPANNNNNNNRPNANFFNRPQQGNNNQPNYNPNYRKGNDHTINHMEFQQRRYSRYPTPEQSHYVYNLRDNYTRQRQRSTSPVRQERPEEFRRRSNSNDERDRKTDTPTPNNDNNRQGALN